LDNNMVAKLI